MNRAMISNPRAARLSPGLALLAISSAAVVWISGALGARNERRRPGWLGGAR